MPTLTQARLKELLRYNPETGEFTWLVDSGRWGRIKSGTVAGCIGHRGYMQIWVDGKKYRSHRLAWFYMTGNWPSDQTDHINGIMGDNRWCNLRMASCSQNQWNVALRADNTSGQRGVCWDRNSRKWVARIKHNGKRHQLGYFPELTQAAEAYRNAEETFFGKFRRMV